MRIVCWDIHAVEAVLMSKAPHPARAQERCAWATMHGNTHPSSSNAISPL
jgi:hypothetical protein